LRIRLLALLCLLSAACAPKPPSFSQDAYVWQRHWTPALVSALEQSSDVVAQWRVLAAETDARGTLKPVAVDWAALRATGRPVIAVIRIDGALGHLSQPELLTEIGALAAGWRGLPVIGLEIDYDCATARLRDYAQFLTRLRALRGIPRYLSITALPTWIGATALAPVVTAADETVLQVHAVQAPENGLFDPASARRWIDAFAAETHKPFRVALPDYGARAVRDEDGRLIAIESETPRLVGGAETTALMAMPDQVAVLLRDLKNNPPDRFSGVAWFRLPSADDQLTWSLATWRVVMRGADLRTDVVAEARASTTPGMSNIVLANRGAIDAALPRMVTLPADCRTADGINGYALDTRDEKYSLHRLQTALLRAHHERLVGWMRCAQGALDVRP
jgi:Protein of unknown function (DUF3142)